MLANFLSKSKPINFIILFGLFFCLFTVFNVINVFVISFNFSVVLEFLGFLTLFLVVFFFFNFVITKNELTLDNSYAYYIFTIITAYFFCVILDFEVLLPFLTQILFLRKIYSLKSNKNIFQKLFDSGFWLGILFLLEPFTALFGVLIYAGIFLHQKPIINSIIIPILGFVTPLILFFTYCFGIDEVYTFTNLFYFDAFSSLNFFNEGYFYSVALFMVLLAAFGIVLKSPKALAVNNSFKKSWLLLILHLVIVILYNMLQPNKNGAELLFLIFPTAVLGANGFEALKSKIFKNLLLALLLTSIFIVPFVL